MELPKDELNTRSTSSENDSAVADALEAVAKATYEAEIAQLAARRSVAHARQLGATSIQIAVTLGALSEDSKNDSAEHAYLRNALETGGVIYYRLTGYGGAEPVLPPALESHPFLSPDA